MLAALCSEALTFRVHVRDEHVELMSTDTGTNGRLQSVEGALRWFGSAPDISARIIWMTNRPSPAKVSFER